MAGGYRNNLRPPGAATAPPSSAPALQMTPTARCGSEVLRAGRCHDGPLLFGADPAKAGSCVQASRNRTMPAPWCNSKSSVSVLAINDRELTSGTIFHHLTGHYPYPFRT